MTFAQALLRDAPPLLAEIDIPGQLADDDEIDRAGDLRAERRGLLQAGEKFCRAQIGEELERLAQAEDRLFGTQRALEPVAVGIADRAEQDRVGTCGERQRLGRQRMAGGAIGGTADQTVLERQPEIERLQHAPRFDRHFGTDSVARKNRYQCQGKASSRRRFADADWLTQPPFSGDRAAARARRAFRRGDRSGYRVRENGR